MRFSLVFLIFSLSVFSSKLSAQSQLSFGVDGINHADTLYMGDPIEFNFWIVNNGSISISDSISINCETFDDLGVQISGMQLGSFIDTSLVLDVGDSLFISIHDTVSYQSYVLGDNLVVIWPALLTPVSSDTSNTYLHVLDTMQTNILDKIDIAQFNIFPNPSSSYFILSSNISSPISYFSISDIIGNVTLEKENVKNTKMYVNTEHLRPGVYFVEIRVEGRAIIKTLIIN